MVGLVWLRKRKKKMVDVAKKIEKLYYIYIHIMNIILINKLAAYW